MINDKSEARVVVSQDGPYIVTGNVPLSTQTIVADANGARWYGKRTPVFRRRRNMPCADADNRTRSRSATVPTPRFDFDGRETASRQPHR